MNRKRRLYYCQECGKSHRQYVDDVESGIELVCITCKNNKLVGNTYGALTIKMFLSKGKLVAKCECGKITQFKLAAILSGQNTSCGCGANRNKLIQDRYKHTRDDGDHIGRNIAYSTRVSDAKRRNLEWELTKEQWSKIIIQPCIYCGKVNSNRVKGRLRHDGVVTKDFLYNGIDRVDNSKGYTLKNSAACCKLCNRMKNDKSTKIFLDHIKSIFNHLKLEKNA